MSAIEIVSRKRKRSGEFPIQLQNKYFINQQFLDSKNEDKMNEIHNKTINLLFQGAKNLNNTNNNNNLFDKSELLKKVRLNGNGSISYLGGLKPTGILDVSTKSICCNKNAFIISECRNCNLRLCEHCAYNCIACSEFLCESCVVLFDCGPIESPCCDGCKMFE